MTADTLRWRSVTESGAWARVFAASYDSFLWIVERAAMRRHRNDLLTGARGRTVQIGSGTGLNLAHYPNDLDDLACRARPVDGQRLQTAVRRSEHKAQVIDARAECVRSDLQLLARWQDRLAKPRQRFADGCRCNRATLELMKASGFRLDAHPPWRAMRPIIRPLTIGRATIAT
jgi:hypothetical protein